MWFLSTESVHLYLDSHHAYARVGGRRGHATPISDLGRWNWNGDQEVALHWGGRAPPRRRPLHVYLGSALVKLACVPRPQGLRDEGEREAVLAVALRDTLTIDTDEWRLCASEFADASNIVGAAMKRQLYGELEVVAGANDLRLTSVKPYIFGVINAMQNGMYEGLSINGSGALLVAEADALSVLVASPSGYESASTLLMSIDDTTLDEEARLIQSGHGLRDESVLTFARYHESGEALSRRSPFGNEARSDFLDLLCLP